MIITDVRRTKRGRIAVEADGEYLTSVSEEVWILSGLFKGCDADADALNDLLRQNRVEEAKRHALNMLSARSYTARQLTERLSRKSGQEAAEAAAGRMEELGLLDDADYARRFARELFENRRFAPRRIRLELTRRGLSSEFCEDAIAGLELDTLPQHAAGLIEARFGTLDTPADLRRAAALLERYGYPASIARGVLQNARRGELSETEDNL